MNFSASEKTVSNNLKQIKNKILQKKTTWSERMLIHQVTMKTIHRVRYHVHVLSVQVTSEGRREPTQRNDQSSDSNAGSTDPKTGRRAFISYLATDHLDEADEDVSDSETQKERMRVEAIAIDYILTPEPDLQRTPPGNAGFDLFGINDEQQPNRWIEVKAMVGTLSDHPVGMSRRQFLEAPKTGD